MESKELRFGSDIFLYRYVLLYLPIYLIVSVTLSFYFYSLKFFLLSVIALSIIMLLKANDFFWTLAKLLAPHKLFIWLPKKKFGAPLFFSPYNEITAFRKNPKNRFLTNPYWCGIFTVSYDKKTDIDALFISIKNLITIVDLSKKSTFFFICYFFYYIIAATLLSISILFAISLKDIFIKDYALGMSFLILIIIYWVTIRLFVRNYFTLQIENNIQNLQRIDSFTEEFDPTMKDKIVLIAQINEMSNKEVIQKYRLSDLITSALEAEKNFSKVKDTIIQMSAPIIFVALTAVTIAIIKS